MLDLSEPIIAAWQALAPKGIDQAHDPRHARSLPVSVSLLNVIARARTLWVRDFFPSWFSLTSSRLGIRRRNNILQTGSDHSTAQKKADKQYFDQIDQSTE